MNSSSELQHNSFHESLPNPHLSNRCQSPAGFTYKEEESFSRSLDFNRELRTEYFYKASSKFAASTSLKEEIFNPRNQWQKGYRFIGSILKISRTKEDSMTSKNKNKSNENQFNDLNQTIANQIYCNIDQLLQETIFTEKVAQQISSLFWYCTLSCIESIPKTKIKFIDIWPKDKQLNQLIEACHEYLKDSGNFLGTLTILIIVSPGFASLLELLIQKEYLHPSCTLFHGLSLLHMACMSDNFEVAQLLLRLGANPFVVDSLQRLPISMCHNKSSIKKLFQPFQKIITLHKYREANVDEKEAIFKLANDAKSMMEVIYMLKILDFNVNCEFNSSGDALIHVVMKGGIKMLPLLEYLFNNCKANVNLKSASSTDFALSLAIQQKNKSASMLLDYLICCQGADLKNVDNFGNTTLHLAAVANDFDLVNLLLKRGADFNLENYAKRRADDECRRVHGGTTDCSILIKYNRQQRIDKLCKLVEGNGLLRDSFSNNDLFEVDYEGFTLVMRAAQNNALQSLQLMMQSINCPINAQNPNSGRTALSYAAEGDCPDIIQQLLRYNANPLVGDFQGLLPIHYAVKKNHLECLKSFMLFPEIALGGLNKAQRFDGISDDVREILADAFQKRQEILIKPCVLAAVNGNHKQIQNLVNLYEDGDNLEITYQNGDWPLYLACRTGQLEILQFLLDHGCNIKRIHSKSGYNLLHASVDAKQPEILKYILSLCLINVNARDRSGQSPLLLAAQLGSLNMIRMLLNNGATPCVLNSQGSPFYSTTFQGVQCILETARRKRMEAIKSCVCDKRSGIRRIRMIFEAPWDHYLRDITGATPLILACQYGRIRLTYELLSTACYPQKEEDYYGSDQKFAFSFLNSSTKSDNDLIPNSQCQSGMDKVQLFVENQVKRPSTETFNNGDIWISHVCAVQSSTGESMLHKIIQYSDRFEVVDHILMTDPNCINIQDVQGYSALHFACKLARKKCFHCLLKYPELDINLRTRDGLLPDDLTQQHWFKNRLKQFREGNTVTRVETPIISVSDHESESESIPFSQVNDEFEKLRQSVVKNK